MQVATSTITTYHNNDQILGAGTILEGLREKKKLIVVNNERLMGNHQMDLISALTERKHILGFEKLNEIKPNVTPQCSHPFTFPT